MVPWSGSQTRITSPTKWFPKLSRKGREINILDDLTKKGSGAFGSQNLITSFLKRSIRVSKSRFISSPLDFRQVSGILKVDSEPPWRRRILLVRSCNNEDSNPTPPIGFYIREGVNVQVKSDSLEKIPGVFVSRIVPGSLAETSGLISIGDELLDINRVPVAGKSIDDVTEMLSAHGVGVVLTLIPAAGRHFHRAPHRSKQSLSAPTPRRTIHPRLPPPRPQTPLLVPKKAEVRYGNHELQQAEDLPPQILIKRVGSQVYH